MWLGGAVVTCAAQSPVRGQGLEHHQPVFAERRGWYVCKMLMVGVSRWLTSRQISRCVMELAVDSVNDVVKAGLPRLLVEAASELGW